MFFKTILLTVALALQALASPQVLPPVDFNAEDWNLTNFRRSCAEDQSRCDYSFLVKEYAEREPRHCSFTINAGEGIPAYQTSFSLAKCPEADEYSINGGWNAQGFLTLSVINNKRSLVSFFGFTDETLANGFEAGPQQSTVYIHPIPVKRDEEPAGAALAMASEWKLVDIMRYANEPGSPEETLAVSFVILGGDAPGYFCYIEKKLVDESGTPSKSFYNQECAGSSDWHVSWGHNENTDEVVMTLVNKSHGRLAFFGFNGVSTHSELGENGPSPTKETPWGY
ncbi:hypothetical protein CPLU01_03867 [Colletotrichum plurivorum]|uniref:Uncharacterized protein n=1 Tax=Colletotrichum plurivorum TaxID=2175906 RepID=A0A8H6KSA7_9PEZI|nr:hypothetical protein CPLU01_03867 [Colletotrichum plurivorum]